MGPQPILPSVSVNYGDRTSPVSFMSLHASGLGSCRTVGRIAGAKTNPLETAPRHCNGGGTSPLHRIYRGKRYALYLASHGEIWKERNDRVFNRKETSAPSTVATIKNEAYTWIAVGAKYLAVLLLRM
jgi:hypothetical protein